jgi:hypothetical protein
MFDYYSKDGVTLMVNFKCMRKGCTSEYTGPLENHMAHDEGWSYLHNMRPPEGWSKHWCNWLLCPDCTNHITNFLRGGEIEIK